MTSALSVFCRFTARVLKKQEDNGKARFNNDVAFFAY
jgi:hypothetical protein